MMAAVHSRSVAEELHDHAEVVDQRDGVVGAVLEAVLWIVDDHHPERPAHAGDQRARGQRLRGSRRGVHDRRPGSGPVVADDAPPAHVRPRGAGDLHRLARVGAGVVVVDLVDEDRLAAGEPGPGRDHDDRADQGERMCEETSSEHRVLLETGDAGRTAR
jgi:hypothetical protein